MGRERNRLKMTSRAVWSPLGNALTIFDASDFLRSGNQTRRVPGPKTTTANAAVPYPSTVDEPLPISQTDCRFDLRTFAAIMAR